MLRRVRCHQAVQVSARVAYPRGSGRNLVELASHQRGRPYNDVCTRFVYEQSTDTCYFKAKDAAGGRKTREGYTAG